jgi:DHA2 family multidrug resistance protein
MNYPVYQAGLLTAPRSLGTLAGMFIVGRLIGRVDARLIIGTGFCFTALSLWLMTRFDLQMNGVPVFWSGVLQGLGTGTAYVPMATLAFATLAPQLRNEGAALFSLMRNIGSSVGISVVQALLVRNTQIVHATLSEHLSPWNLLARDPALAARLASHGGVAALNAGLTAQAAMIAYLDDFRLMFILTLATLPLLLLVRVARKPSGDADAPAVAME